MKSTRSNIVCPASKAILQGLSSDGGLFVLDHLHSSFFDSLSMDANFTDIATAIFTEFLDDYSNEQIARIVDQAYGQELFPNGVTQLTAYNRHAYIELYHGPTFAFKDVALSALPLLFDTAKKIQHIQKPTVILTATSGDTGSAALAGFSRLENTHVIVLYPNDGVSPFQEQQMNSFQSDTCTILAVDGNFDDCQTIAKDMFQTLKPEHVILSSANSINIGRIIPQLTYYFDSYFELVRKSLIPYKDDINITVPTGNFGNIYAAYLAKRLGLPIHKLILASNQNKVLTDVFQTGSYNILRPLHKTMSPSMDILISSNLERYYYRVSNDDASIVDQAMTTLKQQGNVTLNHINDDDLFVAGYATEDDTLKQITAALEEEQYLIDPHTAVARHVTMKYQESTRDSHMTLIASTASPYKFTDAIVNALHLPSTQNLSDRFASIQQKTNMKYDPRMEPLLTSTYPKIVVSIQDASKVIRKVIGDLK